MSQLRGRGQNDETLDYFEHQPLANATSQIRLIRVQHRNENESGPMLQLSVKSINREDARKHYRALSYRWGAASPLFPIRMNNKIFKVQQNLFDFLAYVSRTQIEDPTNWDGWWWVDALCIQQEDGDEEKATQIEGMRQTYADAMQAIVWLGPGSLESTRGMESLQRVIGSHDSDVFTGSAAHKELQKLVSADSCTITAMDQAFGNAYWTRVWILQELAVSQADGREGSLQDRLHVVLGDFTTTWDRFWRIGHVLAYMRLPLQNQDDRLWYQKIFARLWNLGMLMNSYGWAPGHSLTALVCLAESADSSKPQDYIFALLGLTNDHCRGEIQPSYSKSGCVVICQAIRWMAIESAGQSGARFRISWTEECCTLAENAQHNPFDNSPYMQKERARCAGLHHELGACSEDTCSGQHCDALEVCRKIAGKLYWASGMFSRTRKSLLRPVKSATQPPAWPTASVNAPQWVSPTKTLDLERA